MWSDSPLRSPHLFLLCCVSTDANDPNAFDLDDGGVSHDAPLEDDFGLSSPPQQQSDEIEGGEEEQLDEDPFATVDGASSANAGAFDSFSNQPVEVKAEEAEALKSEEETNRGGLERAVCHHCQPRIGATSESKPQLGRLMPFVCVFDCVCVCCVRRWEAERATILRDRAAKAESDKAALLTSAREEVSKFYADRDATVSKQQKTNRADEKNYRSDMKTTFESGQRWEKVSKLISTQPRPNEKAGTCRVERMRKLLIQLKAEKRA